MSDSNDSLATSLFLIPEDMQRQAEKRRTRRASRHAATRRPCPNFEELYRPLLEHVQAELSSGLRSLQPYSYQEGLVEGKYYIIGGELFLLAEVEEEWRNENNRMADGRCRCVYANGTERYILLDSVRKQVESGGYVVSLAEEYLTGFTPVERVEGKPTGYIYVLRSHSQDPQIAGKRHLYKVGFSTTSVEERISGAEQDPTYLMAGVDIVASYAVYDGDTHRVEALIHSVLEPARYNIVLTNAEGKIYKPREWFVVPLEVIDSIVSRIGDGSIVGYRYNVQHSSLEYIAPADEPKPTTYIGLKILTLQIKRCYLDEILSGEKTVEYRELKPHHRKRYTYVNPADNKTYLRPYHALRLVVGMAKMRPIVLIEVKEIEYDAEENIVAYTLGRILERHNC